MLRAWNAKINSANFTLRACNAKINSANFATFRVFKRENFFRKNIFPQKFLPLRYSFCRSSNTWLRIDFPVCLYLSRTNTADGELFFNNSVACCRVIPSNDTLFISTTLSPNIQKVLRMKLMS